MTIYRHFDLNIRAAADSDQLTITGIGVPYAHETELLPGYYEKFAPGSVTDDGAILRYAHAEPIGPIINSNDTAEGREITAQISNTTRGRDVATLIRDGVLSKLSIGFHIEDYEEEQRGDTTHITITRARAVEYSVVEFPAYETAKITNLRHKPQEKEHPMPNTPDTTPNDAVTRAEITALNSAIDDLSREIRTMATSNIDEPQTHYRSIGEYAKAFAAGEEHARAAFAGAVIGEAVARPEWIGVIEKRMTAKQILTNIFTHTFNLPPHGMTVEYAQNTGESTVTVDKQSEEGAALAKGKPAAYKVKSAPVETYGGSGEMSIQAIERASVSLLDDLLYEQAMEYAHKIEKQTRALFESTVTENESNPIHTIESLATATVNDWITAILALSDEYDDTPYLMDGMLVSPTVFDTLAKMEREPKALQFTSAPVDHQGTLKLTDGSAAFGEIKVVRVPKWSGNHAVGYSAEALRIMEAPGAPWRLQDSDILDLTKSFSVYGYAAHFAPKPQLLKTIKFNA